QALRLGQTGAHGRGRAKPCSGRAQQRVAAECKGDITSTIECRVTIGRMSSLHQFDLATYLSERFPSLTLGAGLFSRWPVGIRFEVGLATFAERASKLYEAVFAPEDICVIISQDWPENISPPARYFRLFSLPGAFDSKRPVGLQS